jgi:outer membrane PBP1 activator LpoA protein
MANDGLKRFYGACLYFLLSIGSANTFAADRIVVLLPQGGSGQAAASHAIEQGVRDVLGAKVTIVNQDAYPNMAVAWKAVMRYHPDAVIGPLHESDVAALIALSPQVPVLALNQTEATDTHVWQLSLPTEQPVYQLALSLAAKGIDRVLMLTHQDALSERLRETFLSVWSGDVVDAVSYQQSNELAAASRVLLHSSTGRARIQSLGDLLQVPLQGYPWVRQDADALLIVTSLGDALTMSYQVDYLWGQDLSTYWIDSGTNSLSDYVHSTSNWGRMKTFMPQYQLSAMQHLSDQFGFFYALGQDAGRLLQLRLGHEQWDDGSLLTGSLGELSMGENNHIQVKLPLVWLGDGQVDEVDDIDP